MNARFRCPVASYRQGDPDASPGWARPILEFDGLRTALVVMHAWQPPAPGEAPGWVRAVPYLTRSRHVLRTVFPPLLDAVRRSCVALVHVTGCVPAPPFTAPEDDSLRALRDFRRREVFPGEANQPDIDACWPRRQIAPEARPLEGEPVLEDADALHAWCEPRGINHLIYVGFALNWCLLMSPGGMVDMGRRGYLCSTLAEAIVTVESHESAPLNGEYHQALWRVAVEFGFVFHLDDFLKSLPSP